MVSPELSGGTNFDRRQSVRRFSVYLVPEFNFFRKKGKERRSCLFQGRSESITLPLSKRNCTGTYQWCGRWTRGEGKALMTGWKWGRPKAGEFFWAFCDHMAILGPFFQRMLFSLASPREGGCISQPPFFQTSAASSQGKH